MTARSDLDGVIPVCELANTSVRRFAVYRAGRHVGTRSTPASAARLYGRTYEAERLFEPAPEQLAGQLGMGGLDD